MQDVFYYLNCYFSRETSATFTARARSMSVPVCYKMLAFKSDKISVRVEETKVIVNGKETWHNPSRIENQDEVSADSGMLEPKETRVFKVITTRVFKVRLDLSQT